MRVIVYHSNLSDSGCCGHIVQLDDGNEYAAWEHPDGDDPRAFAERLVRESFGEEHVKDLDWEHCEGC